MVTNDPVTGREILLTEAFAYNGQYEAKVAGFRGTAAAAGTTSLDFPVGAEDRYINGLRLLLVDHAEADSLEFKVVDVDNVLGYGAGLVLKTFGSTWNVDHEHSDQGRDSFNFVAKLPAGTYIRVVYTATGAAPVIIKLNTLLYKKVA